MRPDFENKKEQKENSTGVSNEIHENCFGFKNGDATTANPNLKNSPDSPQFDVDTTTLYNQVYFSQTFQLDLPQKYISTSSDHLLVALKAFFSSLDPAVQSKLWNQYFPKFQQSQINTFAESQTDQMLAKATKSFCDQLRSGKFDQNYQAEVHVTALLDKYYYDSEVNKNYIRAAQNYSKSEIIEKTPSQMLAKCPSNPLTGISVAEVEEYGLHSEDSLESVDFDPEDAVEPHKSVSLISSEKEFKIRKIMKKSPSPLVKSSNEDIRNFQAQEQERYANPTLPFVYRINNGDNRWVAPVCRKLSEGNVRPRDHFLLAQERPNSVTILSLVRDAASKLPKGYGTRNDICELLKESQFINNTVGEDKISSVVSGALDRLHYEKDPCVRFDTNKKLWIYLHVGRQEISEDLSEKQSQFNVKAEGMKNKKVKAN